MTPPIAAASPWTPAFTRFFLAQCLSWAGSSMSPVALSFGVLAATGRATAVGVVLASFTLPMVGLLLLGGVVADAVPRWRLLPISHAVSGITQLAIAAWFLLGLGSVPLLAALCALGGAAAAFTGPALRGIVADLVPTAARARANAARTASRNLSRILGPSLGAMMMGLSGAGWVLAVDGACLLVAAAVLATLPAAESGRPGQTPARPAPPTGSGPRRALRDLREGWHEFASRRWLWSVACAFLVLNLLIGGIWLVLGPALAADGIGAASWGLVLGGRAVGQVAGGMLAYRWQPARPLLGVLLAPLPYAAVFVGIGAGTGLPVLLVCAVAAGTGSALGDVLWETTIQQQVPAAALSRVSSLDMMLSFASVPLGQMLLPMIATTIPPATVAIAAGGLCVLALGIPLLSRDVRGLRASAP